MVNMYKVAAHMVLMSFVLNIGLYIMVVGNESGQAENPPTTLITEAIATVTPIFIEPPAPRYDVLSTERELLARVVNREAGGESIECQRAVVTVIFNRLKAGKWGDTLKEIIYAESQFTVTSLIDKTTPNECNYAAVDYVLKYGGTIPGHILYFRSGYHFNWNGYVGYTAIDNTYFGFVEADVR